MVDPATSGMIAPELRPVYAAARAKDIDRYLAALLSAKANRDSLMTVAAFSGEAAQTPLAASDPALAQIRLQWWRDTVENAHGGTRTGSPVADRLTGTLKAHPDLDAQAIALIEARTRLCEIDGPHPLEDLTAFSASAESAAFRMAAGVTGCGDGVPGQIFDAAGIAYGTALALLALPRYLANGLFALPEDVDWAPHLARERARARAHLRIVGDELRGTFDSGCLQVFLPLALVEPYLRALEGGGHDAMRQLAEISPLSRMGRLAWARWRGRI